MKSPVIGLWDSKVQSKKLEGIIIPLLRQAKFSLPRQPLVDEVDAYFGRQSRRVGRVPK